MSWLLDQRLVTLFGSVLAIGGAGCAAVDPNEPPAATDAPSLHLEAEPGVLPLYGLGRSRQGGCEQADFRRFDFWIGQWNVFAAGAPDPAGTNVVTRTLDGCAIEERWTDAAGGRGRSLNTFDRGTGRWNQLWMDFNGLALILTGTASSGAMTLLGDTPKGIGGPIITNRITWTAMGRDRVRQFWDVSEDGRQTWATAFDGDYQRARRVKAAAETVNPFCASRPRYHWFDFVIGDWTVSEASAPARPLGRLQVAKDVSDCLVEWRFKGRGHEGKAFAAFHFPTLTWHRTWIDEDGVRIALTGTQVGAGMVMTGTRVVAGSSQNLRASWTPVSADVVEEIWETSADGGATWAPARHFLLTRRASEVVQ
ncbi:MAG: hypothetical protein SFV24_08990 [Gemmatimonadales bacterium]|nr:hypothetical protein [Gemmatimonadales bacterium]